MGAIAHGHDEIGWHHVVEVARSGAVEVESGAACSSDRAGMDAVRRLRPGRFRSVAELSVPNGCRQLGPGRVVRAHEQDGVRRRDRRGIDEIATSEEADVAATTIARRLEALDEVDLFEYIEMMCEQVAGNAQHVGQLLRRPIREPQFVDDRQAKRITERSEHACPVPQVGGELPDGHHPNITFIHD